jgi:broad specificity phosphatase PhoE
VIARALPSLALLAALAAAPRPAAALDFVYLVRHAEKADGWPEEDRALDPFWPLSPAGIERSRALARHLAGAGVAAVYTSRTVRAFSTGLPLAQAASVPVVVDPSSTVPAEMDAFLARLRERHAGDRAVLVIGHSNTVGELLARSGAAADCHARLGIVPGPGRVDIEGYDGLWRVDLGALGKAGCGAITRETVAP